MITESVILQSAEFSGRKLQLANSLQMFKASLKIHCQTQLGTKCKVAKSFRVVVDSFLCFDSSVGIFQNEFCFHCEFTTNSTALC